MLTDDYAEWYKDYYNNRNENDNGNGNGGNRRRRQLQQQEQHRYRQLVSWLEERNLNDNNDNNNNQQKEGEEDNNDRDEQHSNDQDELDEDFFESLATTNSRGLVFAGVYTTVLGIALSLYGSTVVVGFMSLKGEYIPPCFSFRNNNMSIIGNIGQNNEDQNSEEDSITGPRKLWGEKIHRGVFLGSIVIFSNLMILCAVIFGELQVSIFLFVFGST